MARETSKNKQKHTRKERDVKEIQRKRELMKPGMYLVKYPAPLQVKNPGILQALNLIPVLLQKVDLAIYCQYWPCRMEPISGMGRCSEDVRSEYHMCSIQYAGSGMHGYWRHVVSSSCVWQNVFLFYFAGTLYKIFRNIYIYRERER